MNLDQLSPRERRLLIGLAVAVVAMMLFVVPIRVRMWIAARQEVNDDLRHAIGEVDAARSRIAQRKAALGDVAARYARRAPQLRILINDAAKSANVEIATQNDIPPVPRGKLYSERAMRLMIQKTGLKALVRFFEQLEGSGYPVAITQLDMTKRVEPDAYTINLTLSAYDRNDETAATEPKAEGR